jgi:hypothetical protein
MANIRVRNAAKSIFLSGVLILSCTSAMATDIVRTIAGVLASNYAESHTMGGPVYSTIVRYTPTSTIVCVTASSFTYVIPCPNANWLPGYTAT